MAKIKMGNKRGQVTILIIIAIIIVVGIITFLFLIRPVHNSNRGAEINFESCVNRVVENAVSELELKAGFVNPEFTYSYNGEEFTYLCYTNIYYKTCTIQVPFLKNIFEEQMKILIRDDIDSCYDNSVEELRAQGYSVTNGVVDYNVFIKPNVVRVEINAPTAVGDNEFTRFNIKVNTPIYDMIMIATSILQFETKYGDADISSIMDFYPNYIIRKIKRSDGTTIYILEHKILENKFQFASRSLAWPAGYDL